MKHVYSYFIFPLLFCLLSCEKEINIGIKETREYFKFGNATFIDVRHQYEYDNDGHIKGAILIPLNTIKDKISFLDKYKNQKLIVYCRSGRRSRIATDILLRHGFDAYNMVDGFLSWEKIQTN